MAKPTPAAGDRKTGNARFATHKSESYTYSIQGLMCVASVDIIDLYALIRFAVLVFLSLLWQGGEFRQQRS